MKEQENRRLTTFRLEKDLYVRFKTMLADRDLSMQDYLTQMIQAEIEKYEKEKDRR